MNLSWNDWLSDWLAWGRRHVHGSKFGLLPRVRLDAQQLEDRLAPAFFGGVSVAAGDFDQDGSIDIVTAAGPGGGPHIRVLSGATGNDLASFFAYDSAFSGGVTVAVGDVTGDGVPDIVTAPGAGGGSHVKVFDGGTFTEVRGFDAFGPDFGAGATVAVGDVDGNGTLDIVVGSRAPGSAVSVFNGKTGATITTLSGFGSSSVGGAWVAAGDVDRDGYADVIVGAGAGGEPRVRGLSGRTAASYSTSSRTSRDSQAGSRSQRPTWMVTVGSTSSLARGTVAAHECGCFGVMGRNCLHRWGTSSRTNRSSVAASSSPQPTSTPTAGPTS